MPRVSNGFLRLHIVIKPLNKKITLLVFTENLALVKSENRLGRIGDFGNFLNGFAKSPRVLRTVLNIE